MSAFFAYNLRKAREESGYSQYELAFNCGLTQKAISLYEQCEAVPCLKALKSLSQWLNVSIDWLMNLSKAKTPAGKGTAKTSDRIFQLENDYKSRTDMCRKTGFHYSTVVGWESGVYVPTFKSLYKLCSQTGVSADWIAGLKDERMIR